MSAKTFAGPQHGYFSFEDIDDLSFASCNSSQQISGNKTHPASLTMVDSKTLSLQDIQTNELFGWDNEQGPTAQLLKISGGNLLYDDIMAVQDYSYPMQQQPNLDLNSLKPHTFFQNVDMELYDGGVNPSQDELFSMYIKPEPGMTQTSFPQQQQVFQNVDMKLYDGSVSPSQNEMISLYIKPEMTQIAFPQQKQVFNNVDMKLYDGGVNPSQDGLFSMYIKPEMTQISFPQQGFSSVDMKLYNGVVNSSQDEIWRPYIKPEVKQFSFPQKQQVFQNVDMKLYDGGMSPSQDELVPMYIKPEPDLAQFSFPQQQQEFQSVDMKLYDGSVSPYQDEMISKYIKPDPDVTHASFPRQNVNTKLDDGGINPSEIFSEIKFPTKIINNGMGRGILNALTRYSNVSTFQYVDFILKWEGI